MRKLTELAAAALLAFAVPAGALACDEHADGAEHATCEHAQGGTTTAGDSAAKGSRVVIPVTGMHCGMCAQRVTTALADVDGVKFVETSLEAKQAVVVYDGAKAKPAALAKAIKAAGYEPGKPKTN
jgi:copper chaperone CopZ